MREIMVSSDIDERKLNEKQREYDEVTAEYNRYEIIDHQLYDSHAGSVQHRRNKSTEKSNC